MQITLRYFTGCPSRAQAEERLRMALSDAGIGETPITLEAVETREAAERLGFRGSPTILVDGRDPFADDDAPVGLACRIYATEDGFQGAPSLDQLRAAIAA